MGKYVIPARRKKAKSRSKSRSKPRSKSRSKSRSKPRNGHPYKPRSYTRKIKKRKGVTAANMKWLENKKKKKMKKEEKHRKQYYAESSMFRAPSPSNLPMPKGMVSYKPHQINSPLSFDSFTDKQINNLKPVMKEIMNDVFKSKGSKKRQILKKDDIKKMSKVSKQNPALLTPMMILEANKNKKPLNIFRTIAEGTRKKKRKKKRKSKKL